MKQIEIIVNGRKVRVEEGDSLSYDQLCRLAEINPHYNPTAVFSIPGGRDGIMHHDKAGPLLEGAIYSVMNTGNA